MPAKKLAGKSAILKQKSAKTKPSKRTTARKAKAVGNKAISAKTRSATPRRIRGTSQTVDAVPVFLEKPRARSGGQSGDLQGLSDVEGSDSESVNELLEEGNAFEADVVSGVERAGNDDEVRTHEVPEDDVPGEYLDKER